MAILPGTSLRLTDTLIDTPSLGLDRAWGIGSTEINGTTFVYASAYQDDTIQVMTLSEDGKLTPVAVVEAPAGTTLNDARDLVIFEVDGNPFLAVLSSSKRFTVYSLSDSGPYLSMTDTVSDSDDPATNLDIPTGIESLTLPGGTFLYVTATNSSGISVFSVSDSGTVSNVQNIDDNDTMELKSAAAVSGFTLNDTQFLVVAGFNDRGVSVFSVDPDSGELSAVAGFDGAASGILANPKSAAVAVIDGTAFLYVADKYGDAVTVLSFDGVTIAEEQQLSFSLQPTSNLSQFPNVVEVVELGDRMMLAVTLSSSSRLSFFEIDTDPLSPTSGQLTHQQTVKDNTGEGELAAAQGVIPVTVGGTSYLVVTAQEDDAVNVYEIGGGDDLIVGTDSDDHLSGGRGNDTLHGEGGNDTIDGGSNADSILGGLGDDEIDAGSGLDFAHGDEGNDTIIGDSGHDRLFGGDGDDLLTGGLHDDELHGGAGNDWVDGGKDDDTLFGGTGQDTLDGGTGADVLFGDSGNDSLLGGTADDTITGGTGDDYVDGGSNADLIAGHSGNDTLFGGTGHDTISGGEGDDVLSASSGHDDLDGGSGNDRLYGGLHNDTLNGTLGDDTLSGGSGDDWLRGGSDNDLLEGDTGNDTLIGGTGDDTLIGGAGRDALTGGDGADVFLFTDVSDSPLGAAPDIIDYFETGVDKFDLSGLASGLNFIGESYSFTGTGPEVRYVDTGGAFVTGGLSVSHGKLYVDMDGDAGADFELNFRFGTFYHAELTADDFIL